MDLMKKRTLVQRVLYEGKRSAVEWRTLMGRKEREAGHDIRGDASSGGTRPAVVETGATIKVPLCLEAGEVIKVDTRTREYVERVR